MTFLPEDDQEYLAAKGLLYKLATEATGPESTRNAISFGEFALAGNLYSLSGGSLISVNSCELLIVIPSGYATTKLDSFYTFPRLKRLDGSDPNAAGGEAELFGRKWQFWSRHLDDRDWRDGVDGMSTYLEYVRRELKVA